MSDNPFKGPDDGDPLTSKELLILLVIPRAAQASPDAKAFRLPLGPDPAQGWVDVTFLETCSIIARLASTWKSRLNGLLNKTGDESFGVGPGTTICLFVQPAANGIFHHLAFGALGCTVQYMSLSLGDDQILSNLRESSCDVVLHSGMDDAWVSAMKDRFDGQLVALPREEFAHQLARDEKEARAGPAPPWPEPRRPTPALILHSSGTTGVAKLIRYSLFWYTLFLPTDDLKSYHSPLLIHLITATPVTFCHVQDAANLPSNQLIPWARALDVGSIICSPRFLRELSIGEFEAQAEFLRSLNSIMISGGPVDRSMSALFEKYQLPITNYYSSSESGRGLSAKTPPFTHLRPGPTDPPLVLPISEPDSDGSRQVQLWHVLSTSPPLAHLHARGGASLKLEPFPGEGPHKGELAVNSNDIFQEVRDGETGVAYIFLGRADDMIRLVGYADMNASQFETEFISIVDARWKDGSKRKWMLDAVQLFGNTMPYTALVVQLCPSAEGEGNIEQEIVEELQDAVERVNEKMALGPLSVDPKKRMLVITPEGGAYGLNADSVRGLRLEVTHKHSLQRWKNVQAFKPWLDGLDDSKVVG